MKRDTQHVLLLLLGGALLRIAVDDTFLRYVRPSHRWLIIVAGAVMIALAVVGLVRDVLARSARANRHSAHRDHAPWLLLAPVLVIALVAPPALGADAVTRAAATTTVEPAALLPPLPAGDAPQLTLGEFVQRAVWDRSGSLTGREVTLVGFVVRRGADVQLARLTISCCAADARASRIRLLGAPLDAPSDTWLRVRGTVVPGTGTVAAHDVPDLDVPDLDVSRAEATAPPPDPYEY